MRWKALAEIYTMHSFAPFGVEIEKTSKNHPVDPKIGGKKERSWPKQPQEKIEERAQEH